MIRRMFRMVGRAPARILTSVFALALAVGAIGVFAIPTVSTSSLRAAADSDGIPNIVLGTTDTGAGAADTDTADQRADDRQREDLLASIDRLDNVDRVEPEIVIDVEMADRDADLTIVGMDFGNQEIDLVRADAGRLPLAPGEILVTDPSTPIGATVELRRPGRSPMSVTVVGTGGTSFWTGSDLAFTTIDTAADLADLRGVNRLVVRSVDTDATALRTTANEIRDHLAANGVEMTFLPDTIAGDRHPIESDIDQISMLIGLLGVVAGAVGLVLLGSTTNTLIVERTREVAVMRALGATPRRLRRRLRRIALGIAAAALVIGIPLGIAISNVIARMVLQEFVGLTPGVTVSVPVIAASAAFALIGARVVSARAARRVTKLPLAEALRDREGAPFGRRRAERLAARTTIGGLLDRTAVRNAIRRRARSIAVAALIGAAVAALMIVTSMATTITDFNDAELEPWRWSTMTYVAGPGLDIDADLVDQRPAHEAAIEVGGETLDWEVDVYGFDSDTRAIDRTVREGSWIEAPRDAVVSAGFAERVGIDVGDEIDVLLATGSHRYEVTGLHPSRSRDIFVDREVLATDLGGQDRANRVFSFGEPLDIDLPGVVGTEDFAALDGDDSGRQAILVIFGAIGLVVVSVAGLAVASGLAVNIFERRHEFAALQAIGGRRRHVFRTVVVELVPLAIVGIGVGLVGGFFGGRGVARSFEASNAVEIGFVFAAGVIPAVLAVVVLGTVGLALLMVRRVTHRPIAVTLRGAA